MTDLHGTGSLRNHFLQMVKKVSGTKVSPVIHKY